MTTIKPPVPTPPVGQKQTAAKEGGKFDHLDGSPTKPTKPTTPPKVGGKVFGSSPGAPGATMATDRIKTKYASIPAQAAGLIRRFDSNGDGGIEIAREAVRFEGSKTSGHTVSVESMARAADLRGNHNGTANGAELQALMLTYDVGSDRIGIREALDPTVAGDGALTGSEYDNFMEDYGPVDGPSFRHPIEILRDVPNRYPDVRDR